MHISTYPTTQVTLTFNTPQNQGHPKHLGGAMPWAWSGILKHTPQIQI